MVWQTEPSLDYLHIAYAVEQDVRQTIDYTRGKTSKWNPVYVNYDTDVYDDTDERHERISDFTNLSGRIICNEVSRSIIYELVKDHVDFLPLLSDTITDRLFHMLHPSTELDCLDNERSEFSRLSSGYVMGIKRHVFKPNCVGAVPIFRLPGNPGTRPYVTEIFKQLIEDNNLTGLEFRKVWEG